MGGGGSPAPSAPTVSILSMEADLACLWSNPSALSVSQLVVRRKGRKAADAAPCAGYISLLRLRTEAAARGAASTAAHGTRDSIVPMHIKMSRCSWHHAIIFKNLLERNHGGAWRGAR